MLVVAPVMTNLNAPGGGSDDYVKRPKGNLDVTGQYFIWTSNAGGNRLDAFLVKVPGQRLLGGASDTTAPVISAVAATGVTSSGATIAWSTGEPADTQVEYGPTTAYGGSTTLSAPLVVAHASSLSGLSPAVTYHYRVKSRDGAGNLAVSGDSSFLTPAPPPPPVGSGPLGAWPLSEGSGAVTADASGNGFTGALLGGPSWIAGRIGTGLSLDGFDDYVGIPHAPALDAYPLTVAAWLRTSATGLHGVVNKYLPGSFNGYQIFVSGGSLCAWYFRDAVNYVWDNTSCTLAAPGYNDGRWHHVALVVDAAGGRLYVDGAQKSARAWTGTAGAASTTAELALGRYPSISTPYLPGALDEVRVYNRALSAAEVGGLANLDTTAPILSAAAASGVSSTEATIAWVSSEAADTQVEYGPTIAYGSSTSLNGALVTNHSQTLAGLVPGTLYHVRARSRDAAGNLAVSPDVSFTTLPDPAPGGGKHKGRPAS